MLSGMLFYTFIDRFCQNNDHLAYIIFLLIFIQKKDARMPITFIIIFLKKKTILKNLNLFAKKSHCISVGCNYLPHHSSQVIFF